MYLLKLKRVKCSRSDDCHDGNDNVDYEDDDGDVDDINVNDGNVDDKDGDVGDGVVGTIAIYGFNKYHNWWSYDDEEVEEDEDDDLDDGNVDDDDGDVSEEVDWKLNLWRMKGSKVSLPSTGFNDSYCSKA